MRATAGGTSQMNLNVADMTQRRADELFNDSRLDVHVKTDRLFAWLMLLQWLGGIVVAYVVSPQTWAGQSSSVHPHVYAAIFLGGLLAGLPIFFAITRPGSAI